MTGIELIAKERQEQIEKHHRSVEIDVIVNDNYQLSEAAMDLAAIDAYPLGPEAPLGWNEEIWHHMLEKDYKERLIIAGALLAAEIDRIQKLENDN